MPQGNFETIHRTYAAVRTGDEDTFLGLVDPDIEVIPIGDWPEAGIRGSEAAWEFFLATGAPWEPVVFARGKRGR